MFKIYAIISEGEYCSGLMRSFSLELCLVISDYSVSGFPLPVSFGSWFWTLIFRSSPQCIKGVCSLVFISPLNHLGGSPHGNDFTELLWI